MIGSHINRLLCSNLKLKNYLCPPEQVEQVCFPISNLTTGFSFLITVFLDFIIFKNKAKNDL